MFLNKFKDNKYTEVVLLSSIALFIVIICSVIFIRVIDNYDSWFSIIGEIFSIIAPFIYAVIIAYIINPVMKFFEKKCKLKRTLSVAITYIFIVSILGIFMVYLVPKIANSAVDFVKHIPEFAETAEGWVNDIGANPKIQKIITSLDINFDTNAIIGKVSEIAQGLANSIINSLVLFTKSFIKWVFGFLVSIYIVCDKEQLIYMAKRFIVKIFKMKKGRMIIEVGSNLNKMIGTYIGIKAIDSMIIGLIAFVGLTILKSEYSILIAVIVAITNMIPYFGPFIGMVVCFLINVFFSPAKAVFTVIFLFFVQQFDAWYLDPKLIGGKVGMSPLCVIFAVTVGGGIYGMIGMVLAVPIMAVIRLYINKSLKRGRAEYMEPEVIRYSKSEEEQKKDTVKNDIKDKN
ncbi:Predicted PurR-regulated permease PerM [Hathewaya proteolytica DSM 3090]|uniref:Predicted PurR-regulated permease PerM n=1 Tax=Hathewaya proteolytica DSM 3090 TaxID=1121331 RepID=A0A1M6LZD9_9CLOT|nr:AI-2E family transporter [Hathewaya proteolytica]SHJ76576.1 Predicted PurR-regulated permease PerM [Hathewaya proteolytica DSM 3090]